MIKIAQSLLGISFILCVGCKTSHDEEKKGNAIFQQVEYTNGNMQVSQVATNIIHELNLNTQSAIDVSQLNTASNSASRIEEIVVPSSPIMSDGYTFTIRIDHMTRQYWWTKQGGVAGTIERHGPIRYQEKESNQAPQTSGSEASPQSGR